MTTYYAVPLLSVGLLLSGSAGAGNSMDILWAATGAAAITQNPADTATQPDEPYINRVGPVTLNTDVFLPRSAETGQRNLARSSFHSNQLNLFFFQGQSFSVMVDSESRPNADTLLIGGRLYNKDFSTFSLTITPESYLITLQDPGAATIYRVVGDTQTGTGRVTEIDQRKLPPMFDRPALVPPQD